MVIFYTHNRIRRRDGMSNETYIREREFIEELSNEKFSFKSILKAVELMNLVVR